MIEVSGVGWRPWLANDMQPRSLRLPRQMNLPIDSYRSPPS
jgi:hypothetical protein